MNSPTFFHKYIIPMAFSNFILSFLLFSIVSKAFSFDDFDIIPYEENFGSREIPYEENGLANNEPYPIVADNYQYEDWNRHYDPAYPEDYRRSNYRGRDINYQNSDNNYGSSSNFDADYPMNGKRDYEYNAQIAVDDQRYNFQIGKIPKFLRATTKSSQQIFLDLEQEEGRSRTIIDTQKMGWAKRNGVQIKKSYVQFIRDVKAGNERFKQNRKQILVGLSRQARDLDRKIQGVIADQNLSRQQCLVRINSLLAASTDQARDELREKVRVIGPLDGNFPPIQMKAQQ